MFHRVNEVYSYYLAPNFKKFTPDFQKFAPDFQKSTPDFQKFTPDFQKFTPDFQKSTPDFQKFTPDFKKFDSYENFDDRNRRYGTKSIPNPHVYVNALNKRMLPTTLYQSRIRHKDSRVTDTLSRDQQYHRPQYQQYYQSNRREQGFSPTPYHSSYSMSSSSASSSSSSRLIRQAQNLQNIPRNSTFPGIRGWMYRDFPGYSQVPNTGFRCRDRPPFYGYFADVNAGCQVLFNNILRFISILSILYQIS